jgi:hypothetical protein
MTTRAGLSGIDFSGQNNTTIQYQGKRRAALPCGKNDAGLMFRPSW